MIKFGIVGMGIRGKLFANTLKENPYAEVVAVCDTNPENLKAACELYHVKGYSTHEEMFAAGGLDAAIIATPDFLHKDAVICAAKHVKNIMIEKPLSTSVEECEEMCEVIQKNNVRCLIAFENRWNLGFLAIKNRIETGATGDILQMNATLRNTLFVPTKMLTWAGQSTAAWFLFPHIVDMSLWLSGKTPKRVYANGSKKKLKSMGIDTYDAIQSIVTFTDGTSAQYNTCWVLPEGMPVIADMKFELIGEKDSIFVDMTPQCVQQVGQRFDYMRIMGTPMNGHMNAGPCHMLHAFVDNIRLDTPVCGNELDGLVNTKIIAAVHESMRTGNVIDL